jgi:hypothetical protein
MLRRTAAPFVVVFCCAALLSARGYSQTPQRDDTTTEELPEGQGKKILTTACTRCHGLEEVTKFRGYYTKDDWRDIVGTMVKYGAELKEGEPEVLINYLGQYLSKQQDK